MGLFLPDDESIVVCVWVGWMMWSGVKCKMKKKKKSPKETSAQTLNSTQKRFHAVTVPRSKQCHFGTCFFIE